MAEQVILEVDIKGLANNLLEAQANVESYRLSLDELTEAYGANSKEVKIAEAQLKAATDTQKSFEKQLVRTQQAEQALGGSTKELVATYNAADKTIEQNRKAYNLLYNEYTKADKIGREKLQPTLKKISDTLKEQESAVGDTRRNVGNYQEAFKGAFSEIVSGIPALKSFAVAQQGVNAVMAGNPVGAFVVALQGLISVMVSFAPVADTIEASVEGISTAFSSLVNGGNVVEAANQAYELKRQLQDLEDSQIGVALATSAYDTEIKKLMISLRNKNLTESEAKQIIEDISKAERDRFELNKKQIDEELNLNRQLFMQRTGLTSVELDALIERGKVSKKYTEEEIKNLMEVGAMSREQVMAEIARQQAEQSAVGEAAEKKAKSEKALFDTIVKLRTRQIEIEGESAELREKIRNREDEVEKRFEEKRKKQSEDSIKQAEKESNEKERIKKEEQLRLEGIANENARLEKLRIEVTQEGLEKETSLYELEFEKRIQDLWKLNFTEQQIEEIKQKGLDEIRAKYSEKRVAQDLYANEQIAENRRKADEKLIKQADDAANAKAQADMKLINNIASFVVDAFSQAAQLVNAFTEQNIEALNNQFKQGLLSESEYNKQAYELKVKAFKETKALNITQAIIATLQSSLNAFNSGLQAGGPFGLVLGAIFAAAAAAFGGAQIALIAKQQPPAPQFADGGQVFNVGGKSHRDGGTTYTGEDGNRFEVEKGEKIFVLKKTASRHIDALGGLNVAFGGRAWTDSPISYAANGGAITDGGFAIRATSQEANTTATLTTFAKNLVSNLPNPVVSVNEFERVQKSKDKSVKVAEL